MKHLVFLIAFLFAQVFSANASAELDLRTMTLFDPAFPDSGGLSTERPGRLVFGDNVFFEHTVTNNTAGLVENVQVRGRRKLPSLGEWRTLCTIVRISAGESASCNSAEAKVSSGSYKALIVARAQAGGQQLEVLRDVFYLTERIPRPPFNILRDKAFLANNYAGDAPGRELLVGDELIWNTWVNNTSGFQTLSNVRVTLQQVEPVVGPRVQLCFTPILAAGRTTFCIRNETVAEYETATEGNNKFELQTEGFVNGARLELKRNLYYVGVPRVTSAQPALSLTASVNNTSASRPGPTVGAGEVALQTFSVENTGSTTLHNVKIRGRQKLPVLGDWIPLCSIGSIDIGTVESCTTTSISLSGTNKILATASGGVDDLTAEDNSILFFQGR